MELLRVGARFGNSVDVPTLIVGEFGYDIDTKTMRIGDDTPDPPKIITSKSSGSVVLDENLVVKFGKIEMFDGKTIDGVDISTLNGGVGFTARLAATGKFANRTFESDDYFVVTNPDGVDGNPVISASQKLLTTIGANSRLSWGEYPPTSPSPGDMWYSLSDQVVFIRLADSDDVTKHWWMDISTFGGGGSSNKFFVSSLPPQTASVGDEWYDDEEKLMYKRIPNGSSTIWLQVRF